MRGLALFLGSCLKARNVFALPLPHSSRINKVYGHRRLWKRVVLCSSWWCETSGTMERCMNGYRTLWSYKCGFIGKLGSWKRQQSGFYHLSSLHHGMQKAFYQLQQRFQLSLAISRLPPVHGALKKKTPLPDYLLFTGHLKKLLYPICDN